MVEETPWRETSNAWLMLAGDPGRVSALEALLRPYCHQGRNLLNSVKLSLYLAKRLQVGPATTAWGVAESAYQEVESLFDRLQVIIRSMALARVVMPFELLIDDRFKAWSHRLGDAGARLNLVAPPEPAAIEYDPQRLGQALDALVAWRAAAIAPGTTVELRWAIAEDRFDLAWTERDGAAGAGQSVTCDSLALPLLARVVGAHGGRLELDSDSGLRIKLQWPRTSRHPLCEPSDAEPRTHASHPRDARDSAVRIARR